MQKPMTCKECILMLEKKLNKSAAEIEVAEFQFRWPPIDKMDGALSTLVNCEKLSLSSNMIEKISGIAGMRSLRILSLGRNNIKALAGIETVAGTLQELWISYNQITSLKGVAALKNLKVFYIANNILREWVEVNRLQECANLRDLVLVGNPLVEGYTDVELYRTQCATKLPQINKLDGIPIIRD